MKFIIEKKIRSAVQLCFSQKGRHTSHIKKNFRVVCNKNTKRGHYSSNIALIAAKTQKENVLSTGREILKYLGKIEGIHSIELVSSGFINFFLCEKKLYSVINKIFKEGKYFGRNNENSGKKLHIEYVSANPTGPLHVGHGRSAAYGSCVSNLLSATGYDVHREYYINDFGRQINILALSVWMRYITLSSSESEFPETGLYQGRYVNSIAKKIHNRYGNNLCFKSSALVKQTRRLSCIEDKEQALDSMISEMNLLIGKNTRIFSLFSLNSILYQIKEDLSEFKVFYDNWFYESSLSSATDLEKKMKLLIPNDMLYKLDGATWFRSSKFGDSKDRVLIRSNGDPTYFAMDALYHAKKCSAEKDVIINIFGSDHHGYTKRIESFIKGIGKDPEKIKTILLQFAVLYRSGRAVSMSTRSGEFITIRSLIREIGTDAARFFYITRKPEQHLEFDIDLAKSKENKNPVHYIQYAYARASSIKTRLLQENKGFDFDLGLQNIKRLDSDIEKAIVYDIFRYSEVISESAKNYSPSTLSNFLQDIAGSFHNYYNTNKIITSDYLNRSMRMCLVHAVQQVIMNGLSILGISHPNSM